MNSKEENKDNLDKENLDAEDINLDAEDMFDVDEDDDDLLDEDFYLNDDKNAASFKEDTVREEPPVPVDSEQKDTKTSKKAEKVKKTKATKKAEEKEKPKAESETKGVQEGHIEIVENAETVSMQEDEIEKIVSKAKEAQSNKNLSEQEEKIEQEKEKIDKKKSQEKEEKETAALKKRVSYVNSKKKWNNSDDYIMLLAHLDTLLSHLPNKKIEEFAQSKYFDLYSSVIEKIQNPNH